MRIVMHGHHEYGRDTAPFSLLDSVDERTEQINTVKPEAERPLRLALMQDVTDLLPKNKARGAYFKASDAYDKARVAYFKASDAYVKARDASVKARDAYVKACDAYDKARVAYFASIDVEAFHAEHCHPKCPATRENGWSIFAKGVGIEVLS